MRYITTYKIGAWAKAIREIRLDLYITCREFSYNKQKWIREIYRFVGERTRKASILVVNLLMICQKNYKQYKYRSRHPKTR